MKTVLLKILFSLGISIALTLAYLFSPQIFFSLDNRLRDFMFVVRGELPKNDNIVIVDIDEASLKAYGQWPWSRDLMATLLKTLNSYHPGIIGLDIVFAEPDRTSPHLLSQKFKHIPPNLPNNDLILAQTFQTSPVIGGYIFTFGKDTSTNHSPIIPAVIIQKGLINNQSALSPSNAILNIPTLQNALYSSGFFNNIPDNNGMIRTVPLLMKYDGTFFTSLTLEMVRIYSQSDKLTIAGDDIGMQSIDFANYHVPIDNVGRLIVNFRGPKHHYRYISAKDILEHKVPKDTFENKFVLVGTSALGLYDLRSISYDSNIPGVEIHANVIDNILTGDFLYQPTNHVLYNIMIIICLVFLLMLIWHTVRSTLLIPIAIISLYLLSMLFFTLLFDYGLVLNLLFPLLTFFLTLIISIALDYSRSYRQKEEAKKILGKKVSTAVMNHLLKHADENLVKSKEVEATIFFSDIQGFTSISEKLESPDKLIHMLNTYMTPMVDSIIKYQGTIDKFIGDAIMAYWNAPLPVVNHADKALESAIEQIESLVGINTKIYPFYDIKINIGIGIHTGLVTAGDMGAEGRSDYTIIGDAVNLASRLEGLTRYYDVQIIISKATYSQLTEVYNIRPLDIVEVKGKSKPVEIFEVMCQTKSYTQEESTLYTKAILAYRTTSLQTAIKLFETLDLQYPSKLYTQYLQRCHYFLENPKIAFTPVLKMTTK